MTPSRGRPIENRDAVSLAIANHDSAARILRDAGHRRILQPIFLRVTLPCAARLTHIQTGRGGDPQPATRLLEQIEVPGVGLRFRKVEPFEARHRRIGARAVQRPEAGRPQPPGAVNQDGEHATGLETFCRSEPLHRARRPVDPRHFPFASQPDLALRIFRHPQDAYAG